jgi:hypothetical protein
MLPLYAMTHAASPIETKEHSNYIAIAGDFGNRKVCLVEALHQNCSLHSADDRSSGELSELRVLELSDSTLYPSKDQQSNIAVCLSKIRELLCVEPRAAYEIHELCSYYETADLSLRDFARGLMSSCLENITAAQSLDDKSGVDYDGTVSCFPYELHSDSTTEKNIVTRDDIEYAQSFKMLRTNSSLISLKHHSVQTAQWIDNFIEEETRRSINYLGIPIPSYTIMTRKLMTYIPLKLAHGCCKLLNVNFDDFSLTWKSHPSRREEQNDFSTWDLKKIMGNTEKNQSMNLNENSNVIHLDEILNEAEMINHAKENDRVARTDKFGLFPSLFSLPDILRPMRIDDATHNNLKHSPKTAQHLPNTTEPFLISRRCTHQWEKNKSVCSLLPKLVFLCPSDTDTCGIEIVEYTEGNFIDGQNQMDFIYPFQIRSTLGTDVSIIRFHAVFCQIFGAGDTSLGKQGTSTSTKRQLNGKNESTDPECTQEKIVTPTPLNALNPHKETSAAYMRLHDISASKVKKQRSRTEAEVHAVEKVSASGGRNQLSIAAVDPLSLAGIYLLASEWLLDFIPELFFQMKKVHGITLVDSMTGGADIIVDGRTAISFITMDIIFDTDQLKTYIKELTKQVGRYDIIWLIIIGESREFEGDGDILGKAYFALSNFPVCIPIRHSPRDSCLMASLIHSICHGAAMQAEIEEGTLVSEYIQRPYLPSLEECEFSSHCEFLAIFPTINLFVASRILNRYKLKDLASVSHTDLCACLSPLDRKKVAPFLDLLSVRTSPGQETNTRFIDSCVSAEQDDFMRLKRRKLSLSGSPDGQSRLHWK